MRGPGFRGAMRGPGFRGRGGFRSRGGFRGGREDQEGGEFQNYQGGYHGENWHMFPK